MSEPEVQVSYTVYRESDSSSSITISDDGCCLVELTAKYDNSDDGYISMTFKQAKVVGECLLKLYNELKNQGLVEEE